MTRPFAMRLGLMLALTLPVATLRAQGAADVAVRLAGMTAVSGFERAMVDTLVTLLPGAVRDRAGSVVVTLGSGAPARAIVCPLDEPGYVVGNVLAEGFLTLRRVGTPASPLFDQWHEGHRLTVWTRSGARDAVMAIPSTHLTRGRALPTDAFSVDDAHVDVGAASAAEVARLGIALIDPVALHKAPHRYGRALLAAPEAGRRAACAALVDALRRRPTSRGTVVATFAVESGIRHRGLLTLVNSRGPFSETVLLAYPTLDRRVEQSVGKIARWGLAVRYPGTPVETVQLDEVEQLAARIVAWIGGGP